MRSLNEVQTMVQRAAIGAGIPPCQAEELGRVAAYIAGTAGDLKAISDALTATTPPAVVWEHDCLRVKAGAVALIAPIIRDAFVMGLRHAELADPAHGVVVKASLAVAGYEVEIVGCTVRFKKARPAPQVTGPVNIPDNIWAGWTTLAAKTYVPESEASRVTGAGAGLTDND